MRIYLILAFFLILLLGCKPVNVVPYQFRGTLTGYNPRMCPEIFCGGMFVNILNDTAKNPPPYYLVNKTLAQLGINGNTPFPINVELNFKRDTGYAGQYNFIVISAIKVIK